MAKKKSKKLGPKSNGGSSIGIEEDQIDDPEDDDDGGIIQLRELRLSPIPTLRKRHHQQSATTSLTATATTTTTPNGPPSLRFIRRGHHLNCSGHYSNKHPGGKLRRVAATTATARRASISGSGRGSKLLCGNRSYSLPKIKDVNLIDQYSRFVFPASFAIFNVAYWSIYILL